MKKTILSRLIWVTVLLVCVASNLTAQVATGGSYTLFQSVVANGGGNTSGGGYSLNTAFAQALAGGPYSGGPYGIAAGFIVPLNTPPTITPVVGLLRQRGTAVSNSTIATVGDAETSPGSLPVTVNSGASATVNGVTVSNIVNTNGTITANIVADCTATPATFTLTVTDGGSLTTTTPFTVGIISNTPPVLTYNNPAAVVFGQSGITVNPATGPSDNGSVTSVQLQSPGTFTGNVSVNPNGTISISNAGPVGMHTISIRATDNCGAQTTATFQITVNPAQTATTVQTLINAPNYGSTLTATATITAVAPGAGTPQGTVSFSDGGNPILGCQSVMVTALGAAVCTTTQLPAGNNKVIQAVFSPSNGNYLTSNGSTTQTIGKAPLNVTASSATVTYGDAAPAITSTITGFVLGETAAVLGTQPTCSTTYTQGASVSGSQYPTTCTGAVSNNYSFNYISGTVTVNKKGLTVTADAKSRAYGAANPALTATLTGFAPGDNAGNSTTGSAGLSTTATAGSPVGSYPITATLGTLASTNYAFTNFVNGTLAVTAVQLTVTANNQTRVYGAPNPALTFSITGFVNGEGVGALTGTPNISTTANAASAPGTYPITAAAGTLASPNYTFTTANGTLTVTQGSTTTTITNIAALGNPTQVGQSYAVNWSVAPIAPGAGTPLGQVVVNDGVGAGSTFCTALVSAGTCSLVSTTSGAKTITVTYGGDTNFTGSSATTTHTVINGLTGNVKQFIAFGVNTNLPGVTMTMLNTATQQATTTTTDANGNYLFSTALGQSYTITPSGLGKAFEALSRTYTNVAGNITGGDFIAYDVPGPNSIPRSARISSQIATQGQPVTVPVLMTTTGVETRVAFTVEYPVTALGIPTVTCGTGAVNCTLAVNNSLAGRLGITVTPTAALTPGTRELVKITFPTFTSPATSAAIRFGDFPTARDVINAENNPLPMLFWTDGLVSFTGGTLLDGATISGRVTTAAGQGLRNATVTLIDTAGGRRTTVTSSFGAYQFEGLETGRDYLLTVTSKRYRFATRTVTLTENLSDVNLVGLE